MKNDWKTSSNHLATNDAGYNKEPQPNAGNAIELKLCLIANSKILETVFLKCISEASLKQLKNIK